VTRYIIQVRKRNAGADKWDDFVPWEMNVPDVEHVVVDLIPNKFEYSFRYIS